MSIHYIMFRRRQLSRSPAAGSSSRNSGGVSRGGSTTSQGTTGIRRTASGINFVRRTLYPSGILPPGTIRRSSNAGGSSIASSNGSSVRSNGSSNVRLTNAQRRDVQRLVNASARMARTPLADRLAECQQKLDEMTFKYMMLRTASNRRPRPSRLTRWWLGR